MGLFGFSSKRDREVSELRDRAEKAEKRAAAEKRRRERAESRERELVDLCEEKDSYFTEMISDGLRHGSPLAGKHMSDRKKYLNGE